MNSNFTEYLNIAARECPERIAFEDEHGSMDYKTLHHDAVAIGRFLASRGHHRKPIALVMKTSSKLVAAIYGVLYSGNYYTALSPDVVTGDFMQDALTDFAPCFIIADEAYDFLGNYPASSYESIVLDAEYEQDSNLTVKDAMEWDIFCVIYTSGSTGKPKGVVRTYLSNKELLENASSICAYNMKKQRRGIVFSSGSIIFLQDIMGIVKNGGTGFIINQKEIMNLKKIMSFMSRINVMCTPVSLLRYLDAANILDKMDLSNLKRILFGGEVANVKALKNWIKAWPKIKYINVYASSEVGNIAGYQLPPEIMSENDTIPVGKLFVKEDVLILSEDGNVIVKPEDGIGELYVKSGSNAVGYLRNADLSEHTFVQNPLHHDYRDIWVRTGDLVYYGKNMNLNYAGRNDWVVNRRGYRIELEGIEQKILSVHGVTECGCIYDKENIILFFAGDAEEKAVMDLCGKLLPHYMLPDRIRKIDRIPHNRNGKVDRTELKKLNEET